MKKSYKYTSYELRDDMYQNSIGFIVAEYRTLAGAKSGLRAIKRNCWMRTGPSTSLGIVKTEIVHTVIG